jgi:hypothetical protein
MSICKELDNCGFVNWRIKNQREYKPGSSCGVSISSCARLNPYIDEVKIPTFGVITQSEMEIARPPIFTDDNGRIKRLDPDLHKNDRED